jgi:hypothetical protein
MKLKRILVITLLSGLIIGSGIVLYLFNMPHRDVQATTVDYTFESAALVQEYLTDPATANNKYLQEDGESKVIAVSGVIARIEIDMNQQKVLLLKDPTAKAGVSCTFTEESNASTNSLNIGDVVTIKGVIRSGAGYDEDLELYEDVILEKCALIKN